MNACSMRDGLSEDMWVSSPCNLVVNMENSVFFLKSIFIILVIMRKVLSYFGMNWM